MISSFGCARNGSLTFANRWLVCRAKGNVPFVWRILKTKNVGRQKIKLYRDGWCGRQSFRFDFLLCLCMSSCQFSCRCLFSQACL